MNPYKKILLATDFSRHAEQTAARAKEMAGLYGASLYVLHVVEEVILYNEDVDMMLGDPFQLDNTLFEVAQNRMQKFAEKVGFSDDVILETQWGHPKSNIIAYAEENNIDLIVIGSHGHHGIERLLGSVSSGVSHHAPCDILLVREQG